MSEKKRPGLTISTVNEHLKVIFAPGELDERAVIRKFRTTAGVRAKMTQHPEELGL